MIDPQIRINEMITGLKNRGLRLTPQRVAVIRTLATTHHPTVEQIYEQVRSDFPMISLATVYKIVGLLKDIGEVVEIGFGDYSNHYDGMNPRPHPHLICIRCKNIIDPDIETLDELSRNLERTTGYEIIVHRLDFFGICPDCQNSKDI